MSIITTSGVSEYYYPLNDIQLVNLIVDRLSFTSHF